MKPVILVILLLLAINAVAQTRYVTLTTTATTEPNSLNSFDVAPYEVAELVSMPAARNRDGNSSIVVSKNSTDVIYSAGVSLPGSWQFFDPLVIAGPAKLLLVGENGKAFCTFKILPEAFPPDRTAIVLPGTGGANVTLQCSTNLVNWQTATNGLYTNQPVAKFFRVALEPTSPGK